MLCTEYKFAIQKRKHKRSFESCEEALRTTTTLSKLRFFYNSHWGHESFRHLWNFVFLNVVWVIWKISVKLIHLSAKSEVWQIKLTCFFFLWGLVAGNGHESFCAKVKLETNGTTFSTLHCAKNEKCRNFLWKFAKNDFVKYTRDFYCTTLMKVADCIFLITMYILALAHSGNFPSQLKVLDNR